MATHARLADVALESAEDAVAAIDRAASMAGERLAAGSVTREQGEAIVAYLLTALREAREACEDIERASVGELVAVSWLTGGPSPHLAKRAAALGINVGGLRLVVDNTEPRPRRPRAA